MMYDNIAGYAILALFTINVLTLLFLFFFMKDK